MSESQAKYTRSTVAAYDLPTLPPLPPADRRIAHNNALRHAVVMGDLLARRLGEKIDDSVDFYSEGLIVAWRNAIEHLRSFSA